MCPVPVTPLHYCHIAQAGWSAALPSPGSVGAIHEARNSPGSTPREGRALHPECHERGGWVSLGSGQEDGRDGDRELSGPAYGASSFTGGGLNLPPHPSEACTRPSDPHAFSFTKRELSF